MSLDKSIQHGKEHRKQYRGSKEIDRSCRNHGSCSWCRDNRLHKFKKNEYENFESEIYEEGNEEVLEYSNTILTKEDIQNMYPDFDFEHAE